MPAPTVPPPLQPPIELQPQKEGMRVGGKGKRARDTGRVVKSDKTRPSDVPLSTAMLSLRRQRELQRIWLEGKTEGKILDSSASEEVEVPAFKVGSTEMYRRFPRQYDLLMRCHDCSAVQQHLEDLLSTLQQRPTSASDATADDSSERRAHLLRVADLGCGTGRIACMAARHPTVGALYCYDSETAMLHQCFRNVVQSVSEVRKDIREVRILPAATTDGGDAVAEDHFLCIGGIGPSGGDTVELCVRSASFTDVQNGFFSTHPRCHLVVCAWSLSYVMRASWGGDNWHAAVDATLDALIDLLITNGPAALVIIETLGTDTTEPRRHNTLLQRLEEHYGFERLWVRTDYNFRDAEEAVRLTRFFFGEAMAHQMAVTKRTTLPECTGIWTLWKRGNCTAV